MSVQTASKATANVTAATANTVSGSGIDTWAGYHIAVVSGTGARQMRWCPTSPGANQLDVYPDWDTPPDITSVIHQAKNQADYDVDFGNSFKLVLKATEEWNAGDFFDIGDGIADVVGGWFGQAITLDDYWLVKTNALFAIGSLAGDTSLGGWYFNSNNTNVTLGYIFLQVETGGTLLIHNTNLGTVYEHSFDFQVGSTVYFYDVSFNKLMYGGSNLLGTTLGRNVKFQGSSANHYVNVNTGMNGFEGPLVMSNSNGLVPSGTGTTIIINKFESVQPLQDLEALGSNIFEFNSPKWGAVDGNPIVLWTDNTGNSGWDELFSLEVLAKAGETVLENVRFVIVEGTTVKTLVNRGDTDVNGEFIDRILKRRARTSAAITTYLPNLATAYKYGYLPFSASIDATKDVTLPIPFTSDSTLAVNEATAAAYTGITFTKFTTNKNTALAYDAAVTAFAVDDVVTQITSGASGTVKDVIDNGDGSGTLFLISRNTTAFTDNLALQVSAVTKATADTVTFNQDYSWAIDAGLHTLQEVNDYHMAKLAMVAPVDSWVAELQERFGRVLDKSGTNFFTNNSSSEGAWIYNRAAGGLSYFTADSSTQWIPPSSVILTISAQVSLAGAEVRIYDLDLTPPDFGTEIAGVESNVSATFAFSGSAGNLIQVQVMLSGYIEYLTETTMPSVDGTLNIELIPETN